MATIKDEEVATVGSSFTRQDDGASDTDSGNSQESNETDYAESELDCSFTDSETGRFEALNNELDTVQQQVTNLLALSVFFERKVATAANERRKLRGLRVKMLYRNLAAAMLGRLIATSARDLAEYNTACRASVRRLLQLQDRGTVVRASQKILNHLQSRLRSRQNVASAQNGSIRRHEVRQARKCTTLNRASECL